VSASYSVANPDAAERLTGETQDVREAREHGHRCTFPGEPGDNESGVSSETPAEVRRLLGYQDSNLD
jgi:hypothetical protein